ncbi:MAG: cytochrome c-type biogenesis protein CcmH [Burkholderiales bacterium]|nr:cytochrome c-type biogenesis protein CcmH [Burkholderiales bacterium]
MLMHRAMFVLLVLLAGAAPAWAEQAAPVGDPAVEERLKTLSNELRCLVCQNQSLADSNADLAVDLRNQVREQIVAGRSDAQIRTWLTERYGDFVLYRPPLKRTTLMLWLGPALLLVAALAALYLTLRRRRRDMIAQNVELTEAERRRAEALLDPDEGRAPR